MITCSGTRVTPAISRAPLCWARLPMSRSGRIRKILDIYWGTIEQARPGVKASDVYRYASDAFKREGFQGRVALAGHGVGSWWHQQQPYLVPSNDIVIEAGMVLAFEPHVDYYHLQDMFLIKEDGREHLSPLFSIDRMLEVG